MRRTRWLVVAARPGRRRLSRRRRGDRQRRCQPLYIDRRLLHFLPLDGVRRQRPAFHPVGAPQHQCSACGRLAATATSAKTNWFDETYAHVTSGLRDTFAEYTHDFSDPKVWAKRRVALAHEVRETMRAQDSVTCRSCHDAAAIQPDQPARPGRACADARGPHDLHRLPLQSGACPGAADDDVHPRLGHQRRGRNSHVREHVEENAMSNRGRMSKILAAALLTGGLTAAVLVMAPQMRAQTPPAPRAPRRRPPPPAAAAARHDFDHPGAVLRRMGELGACRPQGRAVQSLEQGRRHSGRMRALPFHPRLPRLCRCRRLDAVQGRSSGADRHGDHLHRLPQRQDRAGCRRSSSRLASRSSIWAPTRAA